MIRIETRRMRRALGSFRTSTTFCSVGTYGTGGGSGDGCWVDVFNSSIWLVLHQSLHVPHPFHIAADPHPKPDDGEEQDE